MPNDTHLALTDEISPDTVKPVVREGIFLLGMIGLLLLGSILPATGRTLPGTDIAVGDAVVGIATLGIVASLLYAAPMLRDLIETSLEGPADIIADIASIGQYVMVFVAVLMAHQGFAPVLIPIIDVNWIYDLAFLLIALIPLSLIAYRFHGVLDPLAQFLTDELLGTDRKHGTKTEVTREGHG